MKWSVHRFKSTGSDCDQRLDQVLADNVPDMSRSRAKKIIDLGGVHINGRRCRSCSSTLRPGDLVEVYIDHLPLDPFRISPDHVVYQDKYLIVLDKPPQIETQPTHARFKGTLYEALKWHLQTPFNKHQLIDIGMVQRLDRGTSGLLAFSLHKRAHKAMTEAFANHAVEKTYLALVQGRPDRDEGEIRTMLARSRHENRVKSVQRGGKDAITRYRVMETMGTVSLMSIQILTGRSHQIRVHMSEQGCPLLGDVRYGGPASYGSLTFVRPLLHASQLIFAHPVTRETLDFRSPLAVDMQKTLDHLKETVS